jgi:hypothetical protein
MSCKLDEKKMSEKDATPHCSAHSKVQIPKIKKVTASHNKLFQPLTSSYAAPTFSSLNRHRNFGDMMYMESTHAFTDRSGLPTSRNGKTTRIPSPNFLNKIDFNKTKTPISLCATKNDNQTKTPSSLRSGYSVSSKISENHTKEKKVLGDTCNTPKTSPLYVHAEKQDKSLCTKSKKVSTTRTSPLNCLSIQREKRCNKMTLKADHASLCDSTKDIALKEEDINESETIPPQNDSITPDNDSLTLLEDHCLTETSLSSIDKNYLLHHREQRRSRNFKGCPNMLKFLGRSSQKSKLFSTPDSLKDSSKKNASPEIMHLNMTNTLISPKPCTLLTSKKFTTLDEEKQTLKPWKALAEEKQTAKLTLPQDSSYNSSHFQKVQCVQLTILDSNTSGSLVANNAKPFAHLLKKSSESSTKCKTLTQEPEFIPSHLSIVSPEGDTECEFLGN